MNLAECVEVERPVRRGPAPRDLEVVEVRGIDLVETLALCSDLLETWGGHPAAVGLTLKRENLIPFRDAFAEAVKETCQGNLPEPTLEIACWVEQRDIGTSLLRELDQLQPFGQSVHVLTGIVQVERRPSGGRNTEVLHDQLGAVMSGTHCHAL